MALPPEPDWSDVRFDFQSAAAAASELRRAASQLGQTNDQRAQLGRAALGPGQWRGSYADVFSGAAAGPHMSLATMLSTGSELAGQLLSMAGRLDDAIAQAQAEQARREAARVSFLQAQAAAQRAQADQADSARQAQASLAAAQASAARAQAAAQAAANQQAAQQAAVQAGSDDTPTRRGMS